MFAVILVCFILFQFKSDAIPIYIDVYQPGAIYNCTADLPCFVYCTAEQSCWNTFIRCPIGNPCYVQCNERASCESAIIDCGQSAQCTLSCDGPQSCSDAQITWPVDTIYSLQCEESLACEGFTFYAPPGYSLICSSYSCQGLTIECPQSAFCEIRTGDDAIGAKHGLIVNGGTSTDAVIVVDCIGDEACSSAQFNGYGTIPLCSGNSSCHNAKLPIPQFDIDYILNCNGTFSCFAANITCPAGAKCDIICNGYNDISACSQAQITAPIDVSNLNITCYMDNIKISCNLDEISIVNRSLTEIPTTALPTTSSPTSNPMASVPTFPHPTDSVIVTECIGDYSCADTIFDGATTINTCQGYRACANAQFIGDTPGTTFTCSGSFACANAQLPIPPDNLNYQLTCHGQEACAGAQITCPVNAMCEIQCIGFNDTSACYNLHIIQRGSDPIQRTCQIDDMDYLCEDDNISTDFQPPLPSRTPTTLSPTPYPIVTPSTTSNMTESTESMPGWETVVPTLDPTTTNNTDDQEIDTDATRKESNSDAAITTILACLFGIVLLILISVIVYKMRFKKSSKIIIGSVGIGTEKKDDVELVQSTSPSLAPSNNINVKSEATEIPKNIPLEMVQTTSASLAPLNSNVESEATNLDPRNYEKWDMQQFSAWISGLEDGRYRRYIDTLVEGMKADDMTPYDLVTEITEPKDFMSYRMSVERKDRGDLIKHFEKLKEGGFEEGFIDGNNNNNNNDTVMEGNVTNRHEVKKEEHKLDEDEFIVQTDDDEHIYPTPNTPDANAAFIVNVDKSGDMFDDKEDNMQTNYV